MHFEILVEDRSGKKVLDVLVPKIIGESHTFKVIAYKGIGRIPPGMSGAADASKRILLDNLPRILNGYGRAWRQAGYSAAVIVVCDLDNRCFAAFRRELLEVLNSCSDRPQARFCIAVEEGEAWLLGDVQAVRTAYPKAKNAVLNGYVNDSICGTWELLANALYDGGAAKLAAEGWQAVGAEKSRWAEKIGPHMDVANNASPSFAYFRRKLLELAGAEAHPPCSSKTEFNRARR